MCKNVHRALNMLQSKLLRILDYNSSTVDQQVIKNRSDMMVFVSALWRSLSKYVIGRK